MSKVKNALVITKYFFTSRVIECPAAERMIDAALAELEQAAIEPAKAVPVAYMRVMVGCRAPDDCDEYLDVCNPDDVGIDGKAFPVYREPPAIVEPAQSAAEPVSKEWDSLSSIGNRLHNISVEQHYAGNEKLSDELGEFASLLWIWERTRKPTVPPAIPAELRGDLTRLCEYLEMKGLMTVSPRIIAKQIREMMGEA